MPAARVVAQLGAQHRHLGRHRLNRPRAKRIVAHTRGEHNAQRMVRGACIAPPLGLDNRRAPGQLAQRHRWLPAAHKLERLERRPRTLRVGVDANALLELGAGGAPARAAAALGVARRGAAFALDLAAAVAWELIDARAFEFAQTDTRPVSRWPVGHRDLEHRRH